MHPKTPSFKIASVCGCVILLLFISLFLSGEDNYNKLSLTSISYAHLSHLPHYNGFGAAIGKYYVDEALDPEFTPPLQPTQMTLVYRIMVATTFTMFIQWWKFIKIVQDNE